jgi:hypothetical protein
MSNSATSAAKRRRAAPMITPPLFQSNLSPDGGRPPVATSVNSNPQQPDMKLLTLQQVISLVDSRLTNLEKTIIEPNNQSSTPSDISDLIKSTMYEHLAEFNERYEILASEIANLKNIVLDLQSYTMNINKTLFEERVKMMSNVSDFSQSEDRLIFFNNNTEDGANEEIVLETMDAPSDTIVENSDNITFHQNSVVEPQPPSEIEIIAKSQKRGRVSNKKTQITLDQE